MAGYYHTADATVSAHRAASVALSNSAVIEMCRALYIGVSGDVKVRMANAVSITFKNVPVGVFPVQADMVYLTGTSATEIIALY